MVARNVWSQQSRVTHSRRNGRQLRSNAKFGWVMSPSPEHNNHCIQLTVYRMHESEQPDVDQVILLALLRGQNLSPCQQVRMLTDE